MSSSQRTGLLFILFHFFFFFFSLTLFTSLFLHEFHDDLLHTLHVLLKADGLALLLAPKRGGTAEKFLQKAGEVFLVEVKEHYDETIWNQHQRLLSSPDYVLDTEYPICVHLKKRIARTIDSSRLQQITP
jgi:hypothetical protein